MISVIIPVYNLENYISECLESILNQTFNEYEIIVIDDGSVDRSKDIIEKYIENDERIKYFYQKNKGLSAARNNGLQKANGEYIIFLDGDDFWIKSNFLEELIKIINIENPDCIFFKSIKFYKKLDEINKNNFDYSLINGKSPKEIFRMLNLFKQPIACAWNKCLRREVLIKNNINFIEGITAEDIDWNIQLFLKLNKIVGLNQIVHAYRQQRVGAITKQFNKKRALDIFRSIKLWANSENNLKEEINAFLSFHYVAMLLQIDILKDKKLLEEIKKYDYLFNYTVDNRIKIIGVIYHIFGIKITSKLLNKLFQLKKR